MNALKCGSCGAVLTANEQVFLKNDGAYPSVCHVVCPKPDDPFDWCRKRFGETHEEHRARMLANVPAGLKRNTVSDDPLAAFFGLQRKGVTD